MKEIITTVIVGLLAWAGICLLVADSCDTVAMLLSKAAGAGLFFAAYLVHAVMGDREGARDER